MLTADLILNTESAIGSYLPIEKIISQRFPVNCEMKEIRGSCRRKDTILS